MTFSHEPYYERMLAGEALELTASGSADIAPTSALITLRPGVRITALWNGEDVPFERELPVFRTDQPLVVQLSRSLIPDRTILHLEWAPPNSYVVDPDVRRRASAVFQLKERTNRLVIPASALAEVASHLPVEEGWFVFRIFEYHVIQDVLRIVRLKESMRESLRAVQSIGFGLYVKMRR